MEERGGYGDDEVELKARFSRFWHTRASRRPFMMPLCIDHEQRLHVYHLLDINERVSNHPISPHDSRVRCVPVRETDCDARRPGAQQRPQLVSHVKHGR